jgi:cold shock CspA family protein
MRHFLENRKNRATTARHKIDDTTDIHKKQKKILLYSTTVQSQQATMMRLSLVSETVSRQISRRWFATGTVKFYDNQKSYGFIEGDGIEGDIFCHRRMISGALSGEDNVPFLRQRERVVFDLVMNKEGKQVAHNVKFENGDYIPHWREKHVENITTSTKKIMGIFVYDILNNDAMNDDSKVTRVMEEFEKAKRIIARVHNRAQQEAEARAAEGYVEQDTRTQAGQEGKEEAAQDDSKVTI